MCILNGTQGWNSAAWVGPFYPPGTRDSEFLPTYSRAFRAVEVDSTFYAVPDARAVRAWAERTPPDFTFALKMPKEITHEPHGLGSALFGRKILFAEGAAAEQFA